MKHARNEIEAWQEMGNALPRFALWAAAGVIAITISAAPAYLDGPSMHDEAMATAASVADAQRTARLQAAIDRECTEHPDPLNCALRVVQREEPHNWSGI